MWFSKKEIRSLTDRIESLEKQVTYLRANIVDVKEEYRNSLGGVMDAAGIEWYYEEPKSGYRKKQAVQ